MNPNVKPGRAAAVLVFLTVTVLVIGPGNAGALLGWSAFLSVLAIAGVTAACIAPARRELRRTRPARVTKLPPPPPRGAARGRPAPATRPAPFLVISEPGKSPEGGS